MLNRRRMKDKKEMIEDGYRLCRICGEPIIKLGGNRKELNSDEFHWACILWARTKNIRKEDRRHGFKEQELKTKNTRSLRQNEAMGEETKKRWSCVV